MRNRGLLFLVLFLLLVSPVLAVRFEQVSDKLRKNDYVDVVIKLKDGKDFSATQDEISKDIKRVRRKYKNINAISARISKKEFEKLKDNSEVESISPIRRFQITLDDSVPLINADDVWNKNLTGKGETVCVLDTGVDDTHPALSGRVIGQHCFCSPDCCQGSNESDYAIDDHGHGTHVCGIIAANGNCLGVAPEVNLVVVKVMSPGGGEGDIAAGIDWCISNKDLYNISVITMSIGSTNYWSDVSCDSYSSIMSDLVNIAVANDIIVFASSGNDAQINGICAPGCFSNVTSVGAVSNEDGIWGNNNVAPILDLLAPGVNIISTLPNNGYGGATGTSMAAPHAAGSVALLKQYANLQDNSLSVDEIKNALKNTGKLINDTRVGIEFPRVDVLQAIYSIDTVNPDLILESPVNKIYDISYVDLNYSVGDLNLDSVWYELNGVDANLSGSTRLNLSNDDYSLILYANDSNGNINSSSISFKVKVSELVINLDSPEDGYVDVDGNITLNCSASDVNSLLNISLYTDLSGNFSLEQVKKTSSSTNIEASFEIENISDNTDFIWGCNVVNNISESLFSYNRSISVRINDMPIFNGTIENKTWDEDTSLNISLNDYFSDEDGDVLIYTSSDVDNINVSFSNEIATLIPTRENWWGNSSIKFNASDGEFMVESNLVNLVVNPMPDCGDSIIEGSEQCEYGDLNNETCISLGYDKGTLACNNCMFDKSDCSNDSPPGGSPSGGGGTPIDESNEETTESPVITTVSVEEPVEAPSEPEITSNVVKEVEKEGFLKVIWVKTKVVFWKIINFFRNIKLK